MRLHAEPDLAPINDRLDDAEGEIVLTQADVATIQTQISDINDVLVSVSAGDIEDEDALALLEGIFAKQVSPTLSGDVFVTPTNVAGLFEGGWLAAQEALGQVANIGTNTALDTATVEGDMVKVDGPTIWTTTANTSNGLVSTTSTNVLAGATEFDIRIGFIPGSLVPGASASYILNSFGATDADQRFIIYSQADKDIVAHIEDGAGNSTVLVSPATPVPDDADEIRVTWTGTVLAIYHVTNGVETLVDSAGTSISSLNPTVSEPLGICQRSTGTSQIQLGLRYVKVSSTVGGEPDQLNLVAENIPSNPDATTITASTGQEFTVRRGTSGPMTTIVPAGKSVIINPDETDTANKITVTDDPTLDISATESAVLMWVGSVGNLTLAQGLTSLGGSTGGSDGFSINRAGSGATNVVARVRSAGVSTQTGVVTIPSTTERIALFAVADRVANLLRCVCVTASGVVSESTVALPATAIAPAGMTAGLSTPSVVEAVAFDKVLWNQGDMVARAVQLLGSPQVLTEGRAAALFGNRVTALEQASRIGTGSPEGVVTAPPGTEYTDTEMTIGAWKWRKATGDGNTGWVVTDGDTGWRALGNVDLLNGWVISATGNSPRFRRRNDTIELLGLLIKTDATDDIFYQFTAGWRPKYVSLLTVTSSITVPSPSIGGSVSSNGNVEADRTASASVRALTGVWTTTAAWPSSLPGTAV